MTRLRERAGRWGASARELTRIGETVRDVRSRIKKVEASVERIERVVGGRGLQADLIATRQALATLQRGTAFAELDVPFPERLHVNRFRLMSQNEEDGITLELLRRAGFAPQRFVEIGCGTNGGNSGFLVDELGWRGVMLDAGEKNVLAVRRRFNGELLTAKQAWITAENIDELVTSAGFEGEIGFLSIDIDGNDYWVWKALDAVQPRVVCLEYNSFWGPDRAVVVPYDPAFHRRSVADAGGHYYGASLAALAALATDKGYRLVSTDHRGVNAFFLRNDVAPEIPACEPARAFRLLEKYRSQLERGWDLWTFVNERGLPVVDVGSGREVTS
jgi:hypothetical protein